MKLKEILYKGINDTIVNKRQCTMNAYDRRLVDDEGILQMRQVFYEMNAKLFKNFMKYVKVSSQQSKFDSKFEHKSIELDILQFINNESQQNDKQNNKEMSNEYK